MSSVSAPPFDGKTFVRTLTGAPGVYRMFDADDELLYQFTVVDPAIYAKPWLAEYSMIRTTEPMYEFACHEGNYGLPDILKGARMNEKRAALAASAAPAPATPAVPAKPR